MDAPGTISLLNSDCNCIFPGGPYPSGSPPSGRAQRPGAGHRVVPAQRQRHRQRLRGLRSQGTLHNLTWS